MAKLKGPQLSLIVAAWFETPQRVLGIDQHSYYDSSTRVLEDWWDQRVQSIKLIKFYGK